MKQSKDYYRYIGAEVFIKGERAALRTHNQALTGAVWRRKSARADVLAHRDFVLKTILHLLENYDVLRSVSLYGARAPVTRCSVAV